MFQFAFGMFTRRAGFWQTNGGMPPRLIEVVAILVAIFYAKPSAFWDMFNGNFRIQFMEVLYHMFGHILGEYSLT